MQGILSTLVAGSFGWFVASSLWIYPHSLSYFNESIGGPLNGAEHLLGSNVDWGQDFYILAKLVERVPSEKLYISAKSLYDIRDLGIQCAAWDGGATSNPRRLFTGNSSVDWPEGFYVVGVDRLFQANAAWEDFPVAKGISISSADLNSLTLLTPGFVYFDVRCDTSPE